MFHQQSAKPLKNIILAREWMWLNTCHNFLSVVTSTRLKLGHNYKFSWYTFARQPGADGMVLNAANYLSLKSQTYTPTHPFVSDALPGCVWWSYPPFCVDRSSPFFCAPSRGGGAAHWRWKSWQESFVTWRKFFKPCQVCVKPSGCHPDSAKVSFFAEQAALFVVTWLLEHLPLVSGSAGSQFRRLICSVQSDCRPEQRSRVRAGSDLCLWRKQ